MQIVYTMEAELHRNRNVSLEITVPGLHQNTPPPVRISIQIEYETRTQTLKIQQIMTRNKVQKTHNAQITQRVVLRLTDVAVGAPQAAETFERNMEMSVYYHNAQGQCTAGNHLVETTD
jgi:glycosyltransferase A (GT-A) superfamily protein (DUF2064 family)